MLFRRKKLVLKKSPLQYGRGPLSHSAVTLSRNQKFLRTIGPTNFHTRQNKKPILEKIRRIHKRVPKFTKLTFSILIILTAIYTIFFSDFLVIDQIESVNSDIINDLKDYRGQSILFINKDEIKAQIQEKYPEIENIEVSRSLPSTLVISFTEYPVAANILNFNNNLSKKYVVNSIGYVVSENADNPSLPYIKIKTDAPINPNAAIIEREKLDYILGAIQYFKEKFGMNIIEAEYKVIPREVHLRTEKFFYIWLDIQKPFDQQLKKLKKALVKLDIYTTPLEYIDLRISGESGDKIIYKRR